MITNPVPWPDGAGCAVSINFDMNSDSILHLAHPEQAHKPVSSMSWLQYDQVAIPRILVIEDAAQAHGSRWRGRHVGSLGHLGSFSFQASKNMTAGEKGIVTTDETGLRDAVWSQANQGRPSGQGRDQNLGLWHEHEGQGSNGRMTRFQAALLLGQLERLDGLVAVKEANGERLDGALASVPRLTPQVTYSEQTTSGRHLHVFKFDAAQFGAMAWEQFVEALRAEGIPCHVGYPRPLSDQRVFAEGRLRRRRYPDNGEYRSPAADTDFGQAPALPVTRQAGETAVWLPQNVLLGTSADTDDVVTAIERIPGAMAWSDYSRSLACS